MFQHCFIYLGRILDRDTKASCTAVDIGNISRAAETFRDHCGKSVRLSGYSTLFSFLAGIHICFCIQFCFFVVILTTRCLQVEFLDQELEDEEIQEEINDTDRDDQHPACLIISLQDTEEEQIQETA